MQVEMGESSTAYSGKKFEFCEIEWVIDNFCLSSYKDNWIFQTPEFEIGGFHTTRWVMILAVQTFEMNFLKVSLRRSDQDLGPDVVWVDWRIEMDRPHCQHDPAHRLSCFRKGSQCGEDLGIMTSILNALEPFESDSIELHLQMIIYSQESSEGFQPCSNIGIRSLSEDLLRFFSRNEYRDLELEFKTASIKAHKIVACSRLKELNLMLEQQGRKTIEDQYGTRDVLDLSFLNYAAMVTVMRYAYSGDLKHVLSEPSLFIYDCIQKFDLPEVKSYYVPHELCFRSSVDKSEFNFAWIIPEKGDLRINRMMKSPVFTDLSSGTTWQLHLAPSGDGNSDYYDLRVESMVEKELVACIECGLADDNNQFLIGKRMGSSPPQTLKIYDFDKFLSRSVVESFPENKCLKVTVKIRLSNGATSNCIEKQNILFIESVPAEKCYYLLSVHMDSAYNAGLFSDLHLEINSIVYKMHKSIIAARSSKMHELVSQMSSNGANPFSNTEPSIFCMLLRFLYTGVVLESSFEGDFVDLYDTAMDLDLMVLKDLCVLFLQVQMEHNLVIRARVYEISVKHDDQVLIELVRKHISEM